MNSCNLPHGHRSPIDSSQIIDQLDVEEIFEAYHAWIDGGAQAYFGRKNGLIMHCKVFFIRSGFS